LLALRKVRKVAVVMRLKRLVAEIDQAIAHDLHTRELDLRWNARKGAPTNPGALQEIDNLADNALTGLRDGAVSATRGARPGEPIHDTVESFLEELIPGGVHAITSLPYPDQYAALEVMVGKLQGPLASTVTALGLDTQAARLAALTAEYRVALENRGESDAIQYAEVQAARELGQTNLLEIVASIMGTFYQSRNPEHMTARSDLLGPILDENERIRAYLRARRGRNGAGETDDIPDSDELPESELPESELPESEGELAAQGGAPVSGSVQA
jgi:hypothetical protein